VFELQPTPRGRQALTVAMTRGLEQGGVIQKTIRMLTDSPVLECDYTLHSIRVPVIGMEFNVALRDPRYLTRPGEQAKTSRFEVSDPHLGVSVVLELTPAARLLHGPIETVSESEGGLERTFQGVWLWWFWELPEDQGRGGSRTSRKGQGGLAHDSSTWQGRVRWTLRECR
jgi:hypothetical protein